MKAGLNKEGVFISIVVAESLMTIIAWIVFRRGKWKLKEV
jgi:Na+-driven multidrug efflux pump